ncbi:hypothetical protein [Eisenibacter elegans]|uniref:hypothetical protein n=1 Tax=Eisenibacter elegans TaxID=997 RepID=UPI000412547C|nr:hypothetical protein [Eisenibacter elegans]
MDYLFQNDYCRIYTPKPDLPEVLHIAWVGYWEVNEGLVAALNASLDIIAARKIKVLISDCRELDVLTDELSNHLQTQWYPQAQERGLLLELYLDSEDFVGQISLEMLFSDVANSAQLQTLAVDNLTHAFEFAATYLSTRKT